MFNQSHTLNKDKITEILRTSELGSKFYLYDEVTSTFDKAEELSPIHGTVVCARIQTNGRGRLGRTWESQAGGIYFSLILSADRLGEIYPIVTNACAIGIQRAIAHYTPCLIKWPNDIVTHDGKKLCGILTRLKSMGLQAGFVNVGIGINANNDNFGNELSYAVSISEKIGKAVDENRLLCDALAETENVLSLSADSVIDEYSKHCITLNSRVRAIYAATGEEITGTCEKIEKDGSAIIKTDDGIYVSINSGEVSVRGIYGESYV